jgi:hypothetical protein
VQKSIDRNFSFPYHTADYEQVPCNLCGRDNVEVINTRDRNGLKVQSCICKYCGLIYVNPRMTPRWYGEYYKTEYRLQMARFRKMPAALPDFNEMFCKSAAHGIELAVTFQNYWRKGLTVEAGSSVGGVLHGVRQELGVEVLGIEPSPEESAHANRQGIKTYTSLVENFRDELPPVANFVCTQSLNHFLDPRYFMAWAHRHLAMDGLLILEVMNFRQVFRRYGWMRRAIQIDHTYMFVPETLANFVQAAGFEILHLDSGEGAGKRTKRDTLPGMHIRIAAGKLDRTPFSDSNIITQEYASITRSLNKVPVRPFRYFMKDRLKKWLKHRFQKPGIAKTFTAVL